MIDAIQPQLSILRRKQVQVRTGLSRSTIYLYIKAEQFPRPVALGPRAVGCSTYESIHTQENKSTVTFDQDYAAVYRLIVRGQQRSEQVGIWNTAILPDVKEAQITHSIPQGFGSRPDAVMLTVDIKEIGPDKTRMDFYPATDMMRKGWLDLMQSWVAGKTGSEV